MVSKPIGSRARAGQAPHWLRGPNFKIDLAPTSRCAIKIPRPLSSGDQTTPVRLGIDSKHHSDGKGVFSRPFFNRLRAVLLSILDRRNSTVAQQDVLTRMLYLFSVCRHLYSSPLSGMAEPACTNKIDSGPRRGRSITAKGNVRNYIVTLKQ